MSNATHVVVKPFEVEAGRQLKTGTEVDASEWRNTDKLVTHRYLKALPAVVVSQQKEAPRQQSGNHQQRR
jgi:hypothetical protein